LCGLGLSGGLGKKRSRSRGRAIPSPTGKRVEADGEVKIKRQGKTKQEEKPVEYLATCALQDAIREKRAHKQLPYSGRGVFGRITGEQDEKPVE